MVRPPPPFPLSVLQHVSARHRTAHSPRWQRRASAHQCRGRRGLARRAGGCAMTHESESAPAAATAQGAQDDRSGDAINTQNIGADAPAQLEFHPLADAFPLLEGREFEELIDDIKTYGQ